MRKPHEDESGRGRPAGTVEVPYLDQVATGDRADSREDPGFANISFGTFPNGDTAWTCDI
jgi:hypothetical protein